MNMDTRPAGSSEVGEFLQFLTSADRHLAGRVGYGGRLGGVRRGRRVGGDK